MNVVAGARPGDFVFNPRRIAGVMIGEGLPVAGALVFS
jgi:hypothetical protein